MKLKLQRYKNGKDSTGSLLFVDDSFFCYGLEDERRLIKIAGETRIPAGIYEIKLRDEGGMTQRYAEKFDNHRGMLWLQDIPNFEWVYIHIGNDDDDTSGCILVGEQPSNASLEESTVFQSTSAYKRLYAIILEAIDAGERVFIEVCD